jgi:hypothetical protein
MAGEIDRALARYGERIDAATANRSASRDESFAAVRMSLTGFDLDFQEVEAWLSRGIISATIVGGSPADFFASGAIGGLAIGLLIAEERQKAEASS